MSQKRSSDIIEGYNEIKTRATERQDVPTTALSTPSHPRMTNKQKIWRFLHPTFWLLLLAVGGPILLQYFMMNYQKNLQGTALDGYDPGLPCDVDPIWSSWSSLFQINIRTRKLSFTTAKIIDIAFDLIVGRVGQACLAWIVYRVYTDTLTRITENGQIQFDLFAAIALQPNHVKTLGITFRSLVSTKNPWTICLLIWTLLAMVYVVVYPTLVSAATSLVAATSTAIQLPNNGTAPIRAYIDSASYSLANTGLSNEPNPWLVSVQDISSVGSDWCNIMFWSHHPYNGRVPSNVITINGTAYSLSNNSQVICGFNYGGNFYPANFTPDEDPSKSIANQIICVPDEHSYQWGASWELLLLILILQITWSLSTLIIWMEVTMHSQLVQRGRKVGMWRTVLDLATPLLFKLGPGTGMYNEKELNLTVRNMPLVHYEAKVEGSTVEEGYSQDVHLVPN